MKNRGLLILSLIIALPATGAVLGRLAAPALARMNYIVKVAEHVWRDKNKPKTEAPAEATPGKKVKEDDEVKAFRATGLPPAQLYAQAHEVRQRFNVASAWFGAWCGLVTALKIAQLLNWRRQREYATDPSHCLACARCYDACPVDRTRKHQELGEQPL
jgi:NAD-dependent dihydropyrimidine dehydrogenase PreA subunit